MKTTTILLLGLLLASADAFAETYITPDGAGGYVADDYESGSTTYITPDGAGGFVVEDYDD